MNTTIQHTYIRSFAVDLEDVVKRYIGSNLDMYDTVDVDAKEYAYTLTSLGKTALDMLDLDSSIKTIRNLCQDGYTMMMFPSETFEAMERFVASCNDNEDKFAVIVTSNQEMIGVIDGKDINW